MNVLLYLIIVGFLIFLFFALIPIVLPIIIIFIAAVTIYIMYLKHKVRKNMEQYGQDAQNFQEGPTYERTYTSTSQSSNEDIIDVEFTEHDDTGKEG